MDRPLPRARRPLHLPRLPLVGRADDLAGLDALLQRPTTRLVTITGLGGIGKTRLALELAGRLAAEVPTTVVELASVSDAAFVVPAVTEALGVATVDGTDAIEAIDAAIGRRGAVLVLDNLEHLPGVGEEVLDLLGAVADLRVVATSRIPLAVTGEHVWHVQPLGLPDEAGGAVELFRSVAEAVDARFVLDDTTRADVIAICRRLGGHPLAIELAAARIRSLGPAALRRELERRSSLPLLTNRSTDAPDRHRDLSTAFAWSHERLADDARSLMRRLAVFEGWATLEGIDAVCRDHTGAAADGDDLLDAITQLVDHHLVDTEHDELDTRYRLAPPLRDVARALLADDPADHRRTVAAHEEHFVQLSRAVAVDIDEPSGHRHLPVLDAAHDDLFAILDRAIARGDASVAADVAVVLSWSWTQHGLFGVRRNLLEQTSQLPRLTEVAPEVRLALHGWRLVVGAMLGDRRSVPAIDLDPGDAGADDPLRPARVSMLLQTVRAAVIAADIEAATAAAEEALAVAAGVDDRWTARAEAIGGMVANVRSDVDTARALGLASLDRARRHGDDKTLIRAGLLLRPLVAAGQVGDSAHRVPSIDEVFRIARRLGDPEALDWVWPTIAVAALERGDRVEAVRHCADALAARRPGGANVEFLCAAVIGVAAAAEDPATTALVHGMLADRWATVGDRLLPAQRAVYRAAVERARDRLGETFDKVSRAAEARPWSASVSMLLEYAEVASGRRSHPSDPSPVTVATTPDAALGMLTPRETEVLRHLAQGRTNKEISRLVSSSPKTVMHHTTAIYRKLGVRGRTEAAAIAHRSGLLEADRLV